MKTKRKLLQQDDESFEKMMKELSTLRPYLQAFKTAYEKLEIGDFSHLIYDEAVTSGIRPIEIKYYQDLRTQLKKAGIVNEKLLDQLMKGNKETFEEFRDALSKLKKVFPENSIFPPFHLPLESISYADGEFFVKEEEQEKLLEKYFRIYLESEKEHRIYNSLLKFLEAFQETEKELKGIKFPFYQQEGTQIDGLRQRFFVYKDGKYEIKPQMIRVAIEHNDKQKEFRRQRETREQKRLERVAYEEKAVKEANELYNSNKR